MELLTWFPANTVTCLCPIGTGLQAGSRLLLPLRFFFVVSDQCCIVSFLTFDGLETNTWLALANREDHDKATRRPDSLHAALC